MTHFRAIDSSGDLSFLNDWTYKLGAELLTPFGREELFNLGVSFRVKYGHLLNNEASKKLPVFRTESQDRMFNSAKNFAAGFFGCMSLSCTLECRLGRAYPVRFFRNSSFWRTISPTGYDRMARFQQYSRSLQYVAHCHLSALRSLRIRFVPQWLARTLVESISLKVMRAWRNGSGSTWLTPRSVFRSKSQALSSQRETLSM